MMSLLAQLAGAVPTSAWEMVSHSSAVTKGVLVFLALLSVTSWGIMVLKWREFRTVEAAGRAFVADFERATDLEGVRDLVAGEQGAASPFGRVLRRALNFFAEMKPGALRDPQAAPLTGSQVEALRLVLDSESADERERLGHFIPWLATIGSVSPLIGLLGTVLGVIDAFVGIAVSGSGNLGAVAPGVAEALTATAAALAVAIPAVFGYNFCANRLNRLDGALESFGAEIIALMVREGRI
ncbi:MAG: MotA/TolQ/ExbB proton channel family protein [Gemmatimonadota bacterium]|nr:MotA/TolQ/ExbB proton channel family protein [Gemmatimonadota bacterium]MDQ6888254.1 MotA/TolQ/ExbB proton channel family protein [Gemmatimonadota bacterium]